MSRNFFGDRSRRATGRIARTGPLARARILRLLHRRPGVNVNDIAEALSTFLNRPSRPICKFSRAPAGLISDGKRTRGGKRKQKLCFSAFDEVLVMLRDDVSGLSANAIEVAMPIGLYTRLRK